VAARGPRETPAERQARRAEIDDPEVVLEAAARFLEARPRSVVEVRRRLGRAGYRSELVEGAIARLTELGMLDDAEFARLWVESRDRAHPRGEHALIIELRQKGIDAPTIAATLKARREAAVRWEDAPTLAPDGVPGPFDEAPQDPDRVAARKLLASKARSLERVADPRLRRQKAYALLARSGFAPDVCREASIEFMTRADTAADDDEPADD
jgi:SOS response regulatory protein OraA/RecX